MSNIEIDMFMYSAREGFISYFKSTYPSLYTELFTDVYKIDVCKDPMEGYVILKVTNKCKDNYNAVVTKISYYDIEHREFDKINKIVGDFIFDCVRMFDELEYKRIKLTNILKG